MLMAICKGNLYKTESSLAIMQHRSKIEVVISSPSDIYIAAYPETVCFYLSKKLPEIYKKAGTDLLGTNSPNAWYEFIKKHAEPMNLEDPKCSINNFTFPEEKEKIVKVKPKKGKRRRFNMLEELAAIEGKKETKRKAALKNSMKIYKKAKENPRKKDTFGHKSWEIIVDGMTVAEYLQNGGRRQDLAWDLKKNNVDVRM